MLPMLDSTLRIPGSTQAPARQIHRRELLRAGAIACMGLGLSDRTPASMPGAAGRPKSTRSLPGFGRARRCLVLYIYGAWSQLDTFDPKPGAASEIRGEFGTIPTRIPGVRVCEHLPRSGRVLDRCTLIRSMSHPWNIHAAAYTLTGNP